MAALNYCGRASESGDTIVKLENYDRLMALYHTGIDVKRDLLQHYLSKKNINLAGYLSERYEWLPSDDVKRVTRTKNVQLSDLGICAVDILLTNHCYDLFWDCCLSKTSLEDILHTYKADLYSLYQDRKHDTESRKSFRKEKYVSKVQWDCLYRNPEEDVINEIGFHLSKIFPNRNLTTKSFDDDMNFVLLSTVCPLYKSVAVVTENQMTISRIAVEHDIDKEVFAHIWELLETNLLHISSHCICEDYYKQKLDTIKKSTFDRQLTQENRKYILMSSFDNPEFLRDVLFLGRVQEEMKLIEVEEKKDLVKRLCGPFIDSGKGSFPLAITEDSDTALCMPKSDLSYQVISKTQEEKEHTEDNEKQERSKRQNYLKLIQLITTIAKDVLVDVLKGRISDRNVGYAFNGMKTRITPLLDKHEHQLLYPDNSYYKGDLSDFDISLTYIILRNLSTICPHTRGWGNDPTYDDRSLSANIDRIRIFEKKFVSHIYKLSINDDDYLKTWREIRQCIIEIGGTAYIRKIDDLFSSETNPIDEFELRNTLQKLKEKEKRHEMKTNQLHEIINEIIQYLTINRKDKCFDNTQTRKSSSEPRQLLIIGDAILTPKQEMEAAHNENEEELETGKVLKAAVLTQSADTKEKMHFVKEKEKDQIGSKNQILNCIGIMCSGMYVECINDKRLLPDMRYAKQVVWQYKEKKVVSEKNEKVKQANEGLSTKKTVDSEFQLMVDIDVDNTVENFKDAVRKGFGLCCRLILFKEGLQLSNESLYAGLSECIQHVNTNKNEGQQTKYLDTAKAISLEFTRRFVLKYNGKFKMKDVYPAFKCKCREKQNKINFCSDELFIIVEVDDLISDLDSYFAGFCIKQQYTSVTSLDENTKLKHIERQYLKEKQESVSLEYGMSAENAENYFNKHSNVLAIVPAFLRSVNFELETNHSVRLEKCITFYCKYKGFIPIGEGHFPSEVLSSDGNVFKIDVTNGHFNLAMRRVGDSVESVEMRGTIGGFLKYYNKDCFMTCAHVVMDADSMLSKKTHPLHRKDLRIFVRDQQGQLIKCGNAIRCIFECGSNNQPGLDVAVIEFEGRQMMNVQDFVIDSDGYSQTCKYLGLSDGYLNENYIDYELLTITKATQDIHAYGSTTRVGKHTVMFQNEEYKEIELQGLGQAAAVANGNVTFPIMIASQAHFQKLQTCLASPKTFRMYNQLYLNIPLTQGDSGTGIYMQNYFQNGCLGMAIAFLNGMSVVTPMKTIFSKLD